MPKVSVTEDRDASFEEDNVRAAGQSARAKAIPQASSPKLATKKHFAPGIGLGACRPRDARSPLRGGIKALELEWAPWAGQWSGCGFDRWPGVAVLELLRAQVAQSGVETAGVVDLVDETRKILCDVGEGFVGHRVDGFDLERLHEALRLGIVVRIAAPAHRADQAVAKQGFPIALRSVLRTAVCVMDATWRRLSPLDRGVERGKRQADIDRAADCIADRSPRPGVEDHRNIGEALDDGDVRYVRNPELVGPVDRQLSGSIGIDRLIMIAVGRRDVAAAVGAAEDRVRASAAGSSCD